MRELKDWLLSYLDYTENQESPELFHVWCGVSVLASTLGRSVWLYRGRYKLYPNHYVVLVAPSAVSRKSIAVSIAREMLEMSKTAEIMAERITNAALLTELAYVASLTGRSEMLVWADELSIFLSKEETHKGLLTSLTRFYNCPDYFKNKLKTVPVDELRFVCLNMLAATTPTDLSELIPGAATGRGFTPRLHLIFQTGRKKKIADPEKDLELEARLVADLKHIKTLQGQFTMPPSDKQWWHEWYDKLEFPENESLDGFYGRKHDTMLKLGMILSTAERDDLLLTRRDMERASRLIDQMEKFMPKAYQEIGRDPQSIHTERVIRQLKRRGGKATKSEILHDNWNKFSAKDWIEISYHLEESGVVERLLGRPTVYLLKKEIG